MNILIPNLGSTSLKYQVLRMPSEEVVSRGKFERVSDYRKAISAIDLGDGKINAVAFKAVLAGPEYCGTFLIDDRLMERMEYFRSAAPVHNAIYIAGIQAFREAMPDVPLIAAFEPEFHTSMPDYATTYGVPAGWREKYGVRRYGYHGASHQYVSERVPRMLGVPKESLRLVSCHLGGSSSLCAIQNGKSIDTTMGFSPQSGLENATRHGELDAFAVLYIMDKTGWNTEEVRQQLAKTGGLAGMSGIPGGDCRDLEKAIAEGNDAARLALDVFVYQVRKAIGGFAVAMGAIDAVAFTGGIGENSAGLRRRICSGLEFLGVELDEARNTTGSGDRVVSKDSSRAKVVVLTSNEELVVARRAYRVLCA